MLLQIKYILIGYILMLLKFDIEKKPHKKVNQYLGQKTDLYILRKQIKS